MNKAIDAYLDRVIVYANLDAPQADSVRAELRDHLLERVGGLQKAGTPKEDAVFQAIHDMGSPRVVGYGLRPKFPWIDVRSHGTARGVIAIGPKAVGIFAFGGIATGVFAFGGLAIGVISMGGLGLALLFAWAGFALAPVGIAYGGFAAGFIALGGFSIGIVSSGGFAAGLWVPLAGPAASYHPVGQMPAFLVPLWQMWAKPGIWYRFPMVLLAIFLPLLIGSNVARYRETKRTRDPRSIFAE